MNFLKVLWSDISNIFRNRFIRVSVIAIIMIPLIYGGLYLAAFWDPYGKTENLPVAVVNLDKGGIMDDKKVNYGGDIVDNLKDNDDLAWKFVKTQKEAEEGLKGDKYYAMIVIPQDFTQRIVDVDKGKLEKPKLIFVANKKKNYVVGLISDKAAKALREDVSKGIMDNFSIKIFDNLYELRDGMEAAADGTAQIRDGVTDLKDKVPVMKDGADKLYDGASTLNDKMKDAADGSNKLRDGLGTLNSKMPDLVDGVSKLYDGSSSLNKKIGDALDGSKQLRDGAISLKDKMPDMSDGVNQLYDGATSLQDGLHEVHDNMPKMVDGVGDLRDGSKKIKDGLKTAVDGSATLSEKVGQLQGGIGEMEKATKSKLIDQLKPQMPTIIGGATQIAGGIEQVIKTIPDGSPVKEMLLEDLDTMSNLKVAAQSLSEAINNNDDKVVDESLYKLGEILNSGKLQKVNDDLNSIPGIPSQLVSGIQSLNNGLDAAKDPLKLIAGMEQLEDGASQIQTQGADALNSGLKELYDGSKKLYDGVDELYDKSLDLKDGTDALYNGSQNLRDGINKFKGTVPDLTNGVHTLSDGTRDLSDGLFKINEGSKTLTDKLGELNQKVPDMQQGVQDLYDGSTDLSDGLLKLLDGSGKLKDGIGTLKDKLPDLEDGVNKLYEGVAQLNDKLTEGASELSDNLVQSSKAMGSFISDPINLKDKPLYEVKKYGEGMAPYFISLALWVGSLMMFFVITEKVNGDIKVGPVSVVLGKYLSYVSVGILQALLISFVVIQIGLRPSNLLAYYSFNVFLSFVFIAIIQNFIFLLGDAGRLLAVIVLVLQLTSSNGTFPGELLPKFFKTIGPFLPFTYSISALREINTGIDHAVLVKDIGILAAYMIVFLMCSVLLKRHSDNIKAKFKGEDTGIEAKSIETNEEVASLSKV